MHITYQNPNLLSHWLGTCFCVYSIAIHHMLCTNSAHIFLKHNVKQNLSGVLRNENIQILEGLFLKFKRCCGSMFCLCFLQVPEIVFMIHGRARRHYFGPGEHILLNASLTLFLIRLP